MSFMAMDAGHTNLFVCRIVPILASFDTAEVWKIYIRYIIMTCNIGILSHEKVVWHISFQGCI